MSSTTPAAPASLPANSSFIPTTSGMLQIAVDATSIGALQTCPRYYQLSIIQGWTTPRHNHHLWFGTECHSTVESYHRFRAKGKTHSDSLREAIRHLLWRTWDSKSDRPIYYDDANKNRFTLVRTMVQYLDYYKND